MLVKSERFSARSFSRFDLLGRSYSVDQSCTQIIHNPESIVSPRPTLSCGALTVSHSGSKVTLCGWVSSVRKFGKDLSFISLRDGKGSTQIKLIHGSQETRQFPLESIIAVSGVVQPRPSDQVNLDSPTGEVEVCAETISLLNTAEKKMPFQFHQQVIPVGEDTLLQYRYLELRQPHLQHNIRFRSRVTKRIRDYFHSQDFLEIETPTLFKSTPEGAREFLVATREKGKFYSLPQSPQQYKQLLMVSGFEKYFQLARCYRDELGRSDRQPEFTQVDVEMAFITPDDIIKLITNLLVEICDVAGFKPQTPFPVMKYDDAIRTYGVDKPDTRFDCKIEDLTKCFEKSAKLFSLSSNEAESYVKAINFKALSTENLSASQLKKIHDEARSIGHPVVLLALNNEGQLRHVQSKAILADEELEKIQKNMTIERNDLVVLSAGPEKPACNVLGKLRSGLLFSYMQELKLLPQDIENQYNFLWVVDFPLFAKKEESFQDLNAGGKYVSEHHPFTAPHPDYVHLLDVDPSKVKGQHYDIVLNGFEIGGGSIRIYNADLQLKILNDILQVPPKRLETFSHLISALRHGAPPHGGIALGLDRILAILCRCPSLRSVIAFPKTSTGAELMTGAPSFIEETQLKEIHLSIRE